MPPEQSNPLPMRHIFRQAIESYFRISAMVESRLADVYVMTAIEGKAPPAKTGAASLGGGFIGCSTTEFALAKPHSVGSVTPETIHEAWSNLKIAAMSMISAWNTTMGHFCRVLEEGLERPVIDETNLTGAYDLQVHGAARNTEEFLGMLRDQLGLVLTPKLRDIEMLVIRPLP